MPPLVPPHAYPTPSPSQARDVYEEAITTVTTVRDFTQVFDAYAQCEEGIISAKMESTAFKQPSEEGSPSW